MNEMVNVMNGEPIEADAPTTARASQSSSEQRQTVLVFQGGGALGAYQAGVYQALHEAEIEPDFVSGVSIGAINAAIIAGNPRRQRLGKLREWWEMVTERKIWHYTPDGDVFRKMRNAAS